MMLADFHFIRPYFLFALVPVVGFIILSLRNKLAQGSWDKVCDAELLPYILQDKAGRQQHWTLTAISIASILAILALAGPTWERLPSPVFRNDAAVVIALDLSQSMNATDIKPSRLVRARYKVADLLTQRKDGLTALIVYAGDAFIVSPLTEDTNTINSQLKALTTDIMPSQGSNTLAAIDQAVDLLQQSGQQQGAILLITDGISDTTTKAAAKQLGDYQLSVLGVGTSDGAPITLKNGGFLKDRNGNIVVPKLDASSLATLARSNQGMYQTISTDDRDVTAIINKMDTPNSQTADEEQHLIEKWDEKGPWLLLLILPFAALYFRKGLLVLPLVMLLSTPQDSYAFDWPDLWQTQDQQAQQSFDQQQYEQAQQQFQSPEWKAAAQYKAGNYQQAIETLSSVKTADSFYNQGNALAQTQQLQQALSAYQQALELDPNHEDAKFNKGLVEQAIKQQQQQNSDENSNSSSQEQENQQSKDSEQQSQQQSESNSSDKQQNQGQQNDNTEQQAENKDSSSEASEQADDNKQLSPEQMQKMAEEQAKEEAEKQQTMSEPIAPEQNEKMTENEQANAQWLQRIPDDPAGLLKRKFKYQYGQRKNKSQQEQSW